ncbi:MAG: chemotaxis protein CheW [Leptolyngbyaceae cyanobacterium bins.349]|nr:chemotaxis protein CheW [Leptolyngbyaceae cyanobacterium bins.349]
MMQDQQPITIDHPILNDCWNQIGVMGDRSCGELKAVIHCHDCPVYAAVGDSLLEREPPSNYINEWIDILAETTSEAQESESNGAIVLAEEAISIMIFRLGNQKLALPVRILQEVTHPCLIQPLPHRSNNLFLGLVNIRGETLLCASLSHLLSLEAPKEELEETQTESPKRMMVAGQSDEKWVFPVDEVYGTYRFHLSELREAPVVITKATEAYTQGVIHWEGDKVNYLDSELLFYTLNHKIL